MPPANSPEAVSASDSTVALPPLMPLPSGCHAAPSQRAMPFAGTPPAVVNEPAAIRSPLLRSSSAKTVA